MTLASRLRCKSTARISNYQDFLQKNRRKILYDTILLRRLYKCHPYNPFFASPRWNEVLPFSIPFDGIWGCFMLSSQLETSKMLHYRQLFSINFPLPSELSQKTSEFFQKTWEIFRKTLDFFQKTSEFFFQSTPREDFSQQIETQKSRKWKSCKLGSSTFNCENRQLSSMDTQL